MLSLLQATKKENLMKEGDSTDWKVMLCLDLFDGKMKHTYLHCRPRQSLHCHNSNTTTLTLTLSLTLTITGKTHCIDPTDLPALKPWQKVSRLYGLRKPPGCSKTAAPRPLTATHLSLQPIRAHSLLQSCRTPTVHLSEKNCIKKRHPGENEKKLDILFLRGRQA